SSAAMWLPLGLAWAVLSAGLATAPGPQESSLLKWLGLSAKPSPTKPAPVPPVLWRMFQDRAKERDPCRVEEFNVPGNIVRVFADQGTAAPPSRLSLARALAPLLPPRTPEPRSLSGTGPGCAQSPRAGGDDLRVWNPRVRG
ncbi:GDF3 factor, partial [Toxostoma redivivum]|nr:GDF3 factor [Toxostoma redivivum]